MQPEHLRRLVRKWTVPIILLTAVGGIVANVVSHRLTPIYQSKGSVLVVAGPGQSGALGAINLNPTQATTTAATLLTEPRMLQQVIGQLHLNASADSLASQITATPASNTELVDVTVRDPSALRAAQIANALMTAYVTDVTNQNNQRINQAGASIQAQIASVQATLNTQEQQLVATLKANQDPTALKGAIAADTELLTQLNLNFSTFKATQAQALDAVSVAATAQPPASPVSPNILVNTIIGAVVALMVGLALAAFAQFLDRGLNTAEDVRSRLGLPCLGVVPRYTRLAPAAQRRGRRRRRVEAAMEAYRRLRTNILFSTPDAELKSIVVTSVHPSEGKTCTAANLAVALASSEKRVLLIDADLRNPDQHRMFRRSLEGGLSELIVQTNGTAAPSLNGMHSTQFENLSLLTSGTIPPNPSELLSSKRAQILLTSLASQQDVVVLDTAPAGVVTDPLGLAAEASATILVVDPHRTNASQAANVVRALRDVGANVVGVVLNKAPLRSLSGYYYRYGNSRYRTDVRVTPNQEPVPNAVPAEPRGEAVAAPSDKPLGRRSDA